MYLYKVEINDTNRKYYIVATSAEQAISCSYCYELKKHPNDCQHDSEATIVEPESYSAPMVLLEITEDISNEHI